MQGETDLSRKSCVPCTLGVPPLSAEEQLALLERIADGWRIVAGHHLERDYRFEDFKGALGFTNRVGELAEAVGHHPEIALGWGRVGLRIWTHKIDGLTESDFVLAAKIDRLPPG